MAILTITVDDELLRAAQVRAAEHGTSVNAILCQELIRFAGAESGTEAVSEFLVIAKTSPGSSGGARTWSRDELHLERFDRPGEQGQA